MRPIRPGSILVAALLAAAALLSLGRNRAGGFPVGVYGAVFPELMGEIAAQGTDTALVYTTDPATIAAAAKEARGLDLDVIAYPDRLLDRPSGLTSDWPISAWYLVDEPDVRRWTRDRLKAVSRRVSEWDPARRQVFVVGQGSAAARFAGIGDAMMLDWYPVPHLPIDSVAVQVDTAIAVLPPDQPLWMVVQAFSWLEDSPHRGVGRFPTFREMRFMSYLAFLHGARGIFLFSFKQPGDNPLTSFPARWNEVARLLRELSSFRPALAAAGNTRHEKVPGTAVELREWRWRLRRYAVVVNRSDQESFPLPDRIARGPWRALFEDRARLEEVLERRGERLLLPPLRVIVLESGLFRAGGIGR